MHQVDGEQRAKSVRSARWDSDGCVSMWWFMYIEGYIIVFLILRFWVLSMFRFVLHSLRNQNKKSIERRSRLLKQIIF